MKFKTQFNAEDFPKQYEKSDSVSMTIPDQSMSVRDIMDRHSRGLSLTGLRVPIYNGEDDFMPDPASLDLAERQELIEDVKDEINDLRSKSNFKPKPKPTKLVKQLDIEDIIEDTEPIA